MLRYRIPLLSINSHYSFFLLLQIAALMSIKSMFTRWKSCALVPILLRLRLRMFRLSPKKVKRKVYLVLLGYFRNQKWIIPVGNRVCLQLLLHPLPTMGLKVSTIVIISDNIVVTSVLLSYNYVQSVKSIHQYFRF